MDWYDFLGLMLCTAILSAAVAAFALTMRGLWWLLQWGWALLAYAA